jgi:hypothetical protein
MSDENLTLRTWRRGTTLMATAEVELIGPAVIEAVAAARRRWSALEEAPATLLAGEDDMPVAREIAAELPDLVADVRQVDGLTTPGWAVAWPLGVAGAVAGERPGGRTIAWVRPGGGPGLVDVELDSGEEFHDLSMGRLRELARERSWDVRQDR